MQSAHISSFTHSPLPLPLRSVDETTRRRIPVGHAAIQIDSKNRTLRRIREAVVTVRIRILT